MRKTLTIIALAGFVTTVADIAINNVGWYDLSWYGRSGAIVSAGIVLVSAIVSILYNPIRNIFNKKNS